jgi:lysozyme family protein
MRTNWENQQVDLKQQYNNMLAQRNLNKPSQQTLLQGKAVVVDNSSAMLMTGLATSALGGVASGIGAYRQYGSKNALFG